MKRLVINTRPSSNADETCDEFSAQGFEVINFPCIEIVQSDNVNNCIKKLNGINPNSVVIFTSQQAVRYAFKIYSAWNVSPASIVIAVGTKTAQLLEQRINNPIFVPELQNSQGVIDLLKGLKRVPAISLICAENGRQEIQNYAANSNIDFTQINVYKRQIPAIKKPLNWLNDKQDIVVLATSKTTLDNLKTLFGQNKWTIIQNQLFVCASARIENYAQTLGLENTLNTQSANAKIMAQKLSLYLDQK